MNIKEVLEEPARLRHEAERAAEKLNTLRQKDIGSMRYDRPRVTGGMLRDLGDRIADIEEAERDYSAALERYKIVIGKIKEILEKALDEAGARVWFLRYCQSYTMGAIATVENIKKRRVQYILECKSNVNKVREAVSYD